MLFPVINADGHVRVARGDYCARSNRRGVDLNRNWADHWQNNSNEEARLIDAYGGSQPFSEPETLILKKEATKFKVIHRTR